MAQLGIINNKCPSLKALPNWHISYKKRQQNSFPRSQLCQTNSSHLESFSIFLRQRNEHSTKMKTSPGRVESHENFSSASESITRQCSTEDYRLIKYHTSNGIISEESSQFCHGKMCAMINSSPFQFAFLFHLFSVILERESRGALRKFGRKIETFVPLKNVTDVLHVHISSIW